MSNGSTHASVDTGSLTVRELCSLARERGMRGAWLVSASRETLIHALETGSAPETTRRAQGVSGAAIDADAIARVIRDAIAAQPLPSSSIDENRAYEIAAETVEAAANRFGGGAVVDLEALTASVAAAIEPALEASLRTLAQEYGIGRSVVVDPYGCTLRTLAETPHPALQDVLNALTDLRAAKQPLNVLLVGPAGTGKTTLARHLADAIGAPTYCAAECHAETTARTFFGGLAVSGGADGWASSAWIAAYETHGAVVVIDEYDALDPSVGIGLNAALGNGHASIPGRPDAAGGPVATRGSGTCAIATANTFGTGPDAQFVGRMQQDSAALDRWAIVRVGYDDAREAAILADAPRVLDVVRTARQKISAAAGSLKRAITGRDVYRLAGRVARLGADAPRAPRLVSEYLRERGWTVAEITRAGLES